MLYAPLRSVLTGCVQQPSLPLSRDVAIPLRHLDTVCEHFLRGFVSLAVDEDPLALLHFQSYFVHRNGAAPNPTMMTPFRPLGGSFQTGLSPTTSRMAPKKAPRMGFPFSVPHVAPLDSPNGRWDRRCRDCSQKSRTVTVAKVCLLSLCWVVEVHSGLCWVAEADLDSFATVGVGILARTAERPGVGRFATRADIVAVRGL